jgi:hypothetical protein
MIGVNELARRFQRIAQAKLAFRSPFFRGLCPHPRETAFLDFRIPTKPSLDWRIKQVKEQRGFPTGVYFA